ncbi:DUF2314 domain-containing protein [Leeuwenhoekiella sp. NPDC079379]|uniref:DUF2314 domain-containing protein n=1 Tax=Leeuwenhoekiella sp. NPDC079379 TaxID=3364122 RepID=UPI0037C77122
MKLKIFTLILLTFTLTCCAQSSTNKTVREGEPDIYSVNDADTAMNDAIKKANKNFEHFEKAIASKKPKYEYFSIKQRFDISTGGEHIWIQDIKIKNGNYIGVVGNEPVNTNEVRLGETITIDKSKISDWMFFDNGIAQGAYTIKVLRDQMTEEERAIFDSETGLIFN